MNWNLSAIFGLCIALLVGAEFGLVRAAAAVKPNEEGLEFFEKHIRPVLVERCYKCHSIKSEKVKGGLLLDSKADLLKGGDSGPAIVPGKPEKSLLIKALRYTDPDLQMPPKQQLSTNQIKDFVAWIKMGAPDPRKQPLSVAGKSGITGMSVADSKKFWSFQPVNESTPPSVRNKKWVKSPVDQFILAKMEARNIPPNPAVDKRTLIRRATFDLTGLPPSPEEITAFLADNSSKAYEKLIDRLLASPAYGERWGRHWLDVVRYADTCGDNSDFPVPTAYKYRNYVINAFNKDMPYDEFLREQIAGDLMSAKSDEEKFEKIIATGYLAISRRFGSRANEFHLTIEDTIDNVGKAMLGLSVSCARCHDHKFDPIPNSDYYALYGIFNSTKYAFPGTEIYRHPKDFVPLATGTNIAAVAEYQTELAELDTKIENLLEQKRKFDRSDAGKTESKDDAASDAKESDSEQKLLQVKADLEDAKTRQKKLEANPPQVEKAFAVAEGKPADAKIQFKGEPTNLGELVPRGFLQVLGGQKLPTEEKGSGRLELAQWITDANNPLMPRVMVNRIWQHHFGRGIVDTPNDFGVRGKAPTHPELLDYLAGQFKKSGWSIKAMHKSIMLSAAYQLSSEERGDNAVVDANNDLFWRYNRRRLDAEEIRDAMLAVSGALDKTMGEEHPFPPENDWHFSQHKPFVAVYETNKRSVYLMQQRIKKQPFLEVFDGADPNATTGARPISTTPIQALFMMNDKFVYEQADKLAVRIGLAQSTEGKRIDYAYHLVFGRPATPEEIKMGRDYLRDSRAALKETRVPTDQQPRAALASYARVLFSSNEFLYVD
ncbi:PSD1 and planctomycete cytochrome C domain-containing protein [Pedosphaera parvula]|nr:PSD1 and planctomycete cytochrome C domain-containing protein [Pedosphaera parvula]